MIDNNNVDLGISKYITWKYRLKPKKKSTLSLLPLSAVWQVWDVNVPALSGVNYGGECPDTLTPGSP